MRILAQKDGPGDFARKVEQNDIYNTETHSSRGYRPQPTMVVTLLAPQNPPNSEIPPVLLGIP